MVKDIYFFLDEVDIQYGNDDDLVDWIQSFCEEEGYVIDELNIVFTTDEKLLAINKEFLQHDFYTDIITFQNSENVVGGEIYISTDRVLENSQNEGLAFLDELHRVIAHGVLHMMGYKDKSAEERALMRSREDFCLNLRRF